MFWIRGRATWGARPLTSATPQAPGNVDTLVVHHTAGRAPVTLAAVKAELKAIERLHMDLNGWSGPGYNIIIDRAGRLWEARGINIVGAHTKGHNTGTFGVSFMGNYETMKPTLRQIAAYRALRLKLRARGFRFRSVKGHRQMPDQSTACPGKHLTKALKL